MTPSVGDVVGSRYTLTAHYRTEPGLSAWLAHDQTLLRECQLFIISDSAKLTRVNTLASSLALLKDDHFTRVYSVIRDHGVSFVVTDVDRGVLLSSFIAYARQKSSSSIHTDVIRTICHTLIEAAQILHARSLVDQAIGLQTIRLEKNAITIADAAISPLLTTPVKPTLLNAVEEDNFPIRQIGAIVYALITLNEYDPTENAYVLAEELYKHRTEVPPEFLTICIRALDLPLSIDEGVFKKTDSQIKRLSQTLPIRSLYELDALLGDPIIAPAQLPSDIYPIPRYPSAPSIESVTFAPVNLASVIPIPESIFTTNTVKQKSAPIVTSPQDRRWERDQLFRPGEDILELDPESAGFFAAFSDEYSSGSYQNDEDEWEPFNSPEDFEVLEVEDQRDEDQKEEEPLDSLQKSRDNSSGKNTQTSSKNKNSANQSAKNRRNNSKSLSPSQKTSRTLAKIRDANTRRKYGSNDYAMKMATLQAAAVAKSKKAEKAKAKAERNTLKNAAASQSSSLGQQNNKSTDSKKKSQSTAKQDTTSTNESSSKKLSLKKTFTSLSPSLKTNTPRQEIAKKRAYEERLAAAQRRQKISKIAMWSSLSLLGILLIWSFTSLHLVERIVYGNNRHLTWTVNPNTTPLPDGKPNPSANQPYPNNVTNPNLSTATVSTDSAADKRNTAAESDQARKNFSQSGEHPIKYASAVPPPPQNTSNSSSNSSTNSTSSNSTSSGGNSSRGRLNNNDVIPYSNRNGNAQGSSNSGTTSPRPQSSSPSQRRNSQGQQNQQNNTNQANLGNGETGPNPVTVSEGRT